ncbi:glycosyl transferase [Stanieria cyanosphaera PCC 7437]|uniref:Glycosyl transferase n=1 Tax=Stanieria cyanosphaera (strain ATCC 29371 / PCC 7437) TaxID=111780 RepID=K9XU85_STAC7|nr:glycosyltransferase [Stanieria cyanosphaera]AFZ36160.1 glycosyl transferase [Stanieria cyanosphaera PCC 7437]
MFYFVTVNYYSAHLINRLIQSLPQNQEILYQLIIINNSPEDVEIKQLQQNNIHILEAKKNLGFGNACNLGLNYIYQQNPQAIVWLINPDAYFKSVDLTIVSTLFIKYPQISILGTTIYTPNGELWFGGGRFIPSSGTIKSTNLFTDFDDKFYVNCDWVSGCSLLINLKNFSQCPQFAPQYFLYYEDFDFCCRYAAQEHQIAITNKISVIHEPSTITDRDLINKFKHSTYSYLITIKQYCHSLVFYIRLFRLIIHVVIILPIKPKITVGKFLGIAQYWRIKFHFIRAAKK